MSDRLLSERWTAEFETWLLPTSVDGSIFAKNPKGPFKIEVYRWDYSRVCEWRLRLYPIMQRVSDRAFKTADEAKCFAVCLFEKQISPWVSRVAERPTETALLFNATDNQQQERDPWE